MFKFLRQYNKWILAVGGTLLMIVFLAPQAIQTLSQRAAIGGAAWATVGEKNEEVPSEVRRQCEQELQVIEALSRAAPSLAITDRPEHWYLLVLEADEAGLGGALASDLLPEEQMQLMFQIAGRSPQVDEAIGKRMAIDRMMLMYRGAAKLSDNRMRREAQRLFHNVDARIVVLEADPDAVPDKPTEEAILEQFDRYYDVDPGEPGEPGRPAFGYRLPNRFKVEWFVVSAESVRTKVDETVGQDGVAIFKHWQRYAEDRGFPPIDTSGDFPDVVRDDLVRQTTEEILQAIEKSIADELLASQRVLRLVDAYFELPEDWAQQRLAFPALAESIQDEYGIALPVYEAVGDRWLTLEDVAEIDVLGRAQTDRFGRPLTASALIGGMKEFGGTDPAIITQVGVAGPVLRDRTDDSIIAFRVTEGDAARPPHDVDEVRDRVKADLRQQMHYEKLLASAGALEEQARADGLLAIALANGEELSRPTSVKLDDARLLAFSIQNNVQIPRAADLPVIGPHRPTIEAIVDRAMALPLETPVRDLAVEDRIFVVPVDEKMALLVVEITGQLPLDQETFDDLARAGVLQSLLISDELAETTETVRDAYSFEALAERHNFKLKARATTPPDETGETEDAEDAPDDAAADAGS